jgi:peptidoglycan L-alanyl-D-glutamate endopeptidase CwlK
VKGDIFLKHSIKRYSQVLIGLALLVTLSLTYDGEAEAAEAHGVYYGLHPDVVQKAELVRQIAAEQGILIRYTDGYRSFDQQDALYNQGRTTEGPVVTNARGGQSYHNYGLAIDFVLTDHYGNAHWELDRDINGNGVSDWEDVGNIAKSVGFTWGGDWESFPDYPHLQLDYGMSLADLQYWYNQGYYQFAY